MLHALVLIPLLGAAIAGLMASDRQRPLLLPLVALLHTGLTLAELWQPSGPVHGGWVRLDPLGSIVLVTISLLFLGCAVYGVSYLRHDRPERPNRFFCLSLLSCLAAMTLVCISQHLGLLWVAVAAATVSMAPQIYYNKNARSIEATWKYLMIGSVGIALALLGIYFLAYATFVAEADATLHLDSLLEVAPYLDQGWLRLAFVFLLVGFGAKLGLAPLHTWKPDAYGEAPGLVGGLLAGGLTNCALLALLRVYQVMVAAGGDEQFYRLPLLVLGLLSMTVAALFLARQADFKRMLAYSSVEHMGILVLALGIGKGALLGMLLHLMGNGLAKGALFLSSGTLHRVYGSKSTVGMRGALRRLPWSGSIFLGGFLAVTAFPPFLPFLSEFTIATSAFRQGDWLVAGLFLLLLAVVFLGMAPTVLGMVLGDPPVRLPGSSHRERLLTVAPPLLLLLAVAVLGIWLPPPLADLLRQGAALLRGGCP